MDVEERSSSQARMKAVMKPAGKTFRGTSDLGNGDLCPIDNHGKMYVLPSGKQWCPQQSHDMKEKPSG